MARKNRRGNLSPEELERRKRVGAFIRARREKLGLSQGDLCKVMGYKNRNSISNVELGREGLPMKSELGCRHRCCHLISLAPFLNCPFITYGYGSRLDIDGKRFDIYSSVEMRGGVARRNTSTETKAARADRCGVFSTDEKRMSRARKAVPGDALAASIAAAFKAISHPTRVRILRALSQGELCVCEISEVLGLSVSATSHQLSLLKAQRLVQSRSDGKLVHYSLGDRFVLALLEDCTRHLSEEEVA